MSVFRAGLLQMRSGTDTEENARTFEALAREAAGKGATYVQSPEMTGAVNRDRATMMAALRPEASDIVVATARRLADELDIFVHVGSTAIARDDGKVANRGFLFAPGGRLLATYDKIHMFDVDLDNGESWRESATYEPGRDSIVARMPFATLGMAVCYDLRFPQLFRAQALAGAEILTMPAAFTRQTGEAHWHVLQRARAIENGTWVLSAAQGGLHQDGRETYGHSLVVDPWGRIVAEAGQDEPGVVIADIDPAASAEARKKIPNLRNAREFTARVVASEAERRAS